MKRILFGLITLAYARVAPLLHADAVNRIPGEYIVVYNKGVSVDFADQHIAFRNITTTHRYRNVLNGFAAKLTDDEVASLRNNLFVKHVECAQVMSMFQQPAQCSTPKQVGSWGLTRIAEIQPDFNDLYAYPTQGGAGVDVYIIDTGIYVSNVDFGGRAVFGFKADKSWSNTDANGHGTHVASTAGGSNYGVAPLVDTLYAVKVLGDDGSGSNAGVIAGVDWAAGNARGKKSVANLSLGGGISTSLDDACDAAVATGLVMVVAAGNDDANACNYSPARASDVVTVGATEQGVTDTLDVRSYFSNYGSCVNIFAPGSEITAAWIGSPTATYTISGTSMASPHVAGLAALLLSRGTSAANVKTQLLQSAHPDMINLECSSSTCRASPNLLAWNGCDVSSSSL